MPCRRLITCSPSALLPPSCFVSALPFAPPSPSWGRQLAARVVDLWWLKASGTMVFMALFFWGYFAVLRQPSAAPTLMPVTALDAAIPFAPAAFPVYASLWAYVSLPPALMRGFRALALFGAWIAALCLFCLALFWLWPTAIPPADIDWALHPEMAFLKGLDASGNACPSLHVASAVFSAVWLARVFRNLGAPFWLPAWSTLHCLAILWSTVAVRQHVVFDVVAGLVVGFFFAVLSIRHVGGGAPGSL